MNHRACQPVPKLGSAVPARRCGSRSLLGGCAFARARTAAGPGSPSSDDSFKIQKGKPIRTETQITLVGASVTDPLGRLVTGLEQDNFRVFEDGVEQEIVHFSSEDVPVSIGVIFDMSGSMTDKIDKSRLAAVQFFRTANPQDEFFLVNFNDRAQLISPFTGSVDELAESPDVHRARTA